MKESLAEYSRILIVLVAFALVAVFILGGTWFGKLGEAFNGVENTVKQEKQHAILEELENREPPTLIVNGATYTTGTVVDLYKLITKAETLSEDGESKVNLKDFVEISCDSPDFDEVTNSLVPSVAGVYSVKYYVKDDYGLSTTKIIKIVSVDRQLN